MGHEICFFFSIYFSMNENLIHYNSILFHLILLKNILHYPESQISPTEDFLNIFYTRTAAWFWGWNIPLPLAFYVCQNRPKCCDVFICLYSQLWCTIQILTVFHRKALERSQLSRLKWKSGLLKMHSRCGDGHRSGQLIWWRNSGYILGMSGLHVWRSRQKRECWPLLSLQSYLLPLVFTFILNVYVVLFKWKALTPLQINARQCMDRWIKSETEAMWYWSSWCSSEQGQRETRVQPAPSEGFYSITS